MQLSSNDHSTYGNNSWQEYKSVKHGHWTVYRTWRLSALVVNNLSTNGPKIGEKSAFASGVSNGLPVYQFISGKRHRKRFLNSRLLFHPIFASHFATLPRCESCVVPNKHLSLTEAKDELKGHYQLFSRGTLQ